MVFCVVIPVGKLYFCSMNWINIHTHKPGDGINIVDPCLGESPLPEHGIVYYSLGIHPLFIDDQADRRLAEIEAAAVNEIIVAVGEAGLDRNAAASMTRQMELFAKQADIAARFDLPLIIHGVRAVPELIHVYNQCRSCQKWIIHGFNNRREILMDLLKHGFYISAGRHVMNEQSPVYRLLPEIPAERLLIETDNSDFKIEEIYLRVAERRQEKVEVLQRTVQANFERLFRIGKNGKGMLNK